MSPNSERRRKEARKRFEAHLERRGMRRTGGRLAILSTVLDFDEHFAPEDVIQALGKKGARVSSVSVYRTLPVLCEAQILRRTCLSSGETKYERALDSAHHDHLICSDCGQVVEFQYEAIEVLQDLVAAQHGFVLTHHHLELVGLCAACQRANAAARSA